MPKKSSTKKSNSKGNVVAFGPRKADADARRERAEGVAMAEALALAMRQLGGPEAEQKYRARGASGALWTRCK